MNYYGKSLSREQLNSTEVVTISYHSSVIKLHYKLMGWLNKVLKKSTKLVFKNISNKNKIYVFYFTVNYKMI
jgi:hypothetical protein